MSSLTKYPRAQRMSSPKLLAQLDGDRTAVDPSVDGFYPFGIAPAITRNSASQSRRHGSNNKCTWIRSHMCRLHDLDMPTMAGAYLSRMRSRTSFPISPRRRRLAVLGDEHKVIVSADTLHANFSDTQTPPTFGWPQSPPLKVMSPDKARGFVPIPEWDPKVSAGQSHRPIWRGRVAFHSSPSTPSSHSVWLSHFGVNP